MTGPLSAALVVAAGRDGQAPVMLSPHGARQLTERIKATVRELGDLLVQAWEGGAAELLGYGTGAAGWDAYCRAELWPVLEGVELSVPARRAAVETMRTRGMSQRAIATGVKVSPATVNSDLDVMGDPAPATVTSLDGRRRRAVAGRREDAPAAVVATVSSLDHAYALVVAQADRGLTYRELCEETGWRSCQASPALTKLAQRGRIVRTGEYRLGCAAYVAAP